MKILALDELPCPTCSTYLERGQGRYGLVWICRHCRAGAVTLPVLRQAAPRRFVNEVWQAALRAGRAARQRCPGCTQALAVLSGHALGVQGRIKVCVRCHLVWLSSKALASFGGPSRTSLDGGGAEWRLDGPAAPAFEDRHPKRSDKSHSDDPDAQASPADGR